MKTFSLSILLLFSIKVLGQSNLTYKIYQEFERGGLCSSTIVLYNNGIYNYEHGCEASSYTSYGKWTVKKDVLYFNPFEQYKKMANKFKLLKQKDKLISFSPEFIIPVVFEIQKK